jgi:hypothetical protein
MDRLNPESRQAAAKGWLEHTKNDAVTEGHRQAEGAQRLARAKTLAQRLAAQLAPLFPVIAAATKTQGGMETWSDAWARQIVAANLSDQELLQGLQGIAATIVAAGNPPLSFSLFLSSCRPTAHLTGSELEARQPHPLLLSRDRTQDQGWCSARDAALSKLRAMGYCKSRPE